MRPSPAIALALLTGCCCGAQLDDPPDGAFDLWWEDDAGLDATRDAPRDAPPDRFVPEPGCGTGTGRALGGPCADWGCTDGLECAPDAPLELRAVGDDGRGHPILASLHPGSACVSECHPGWDDCSSCAHCVADAAVGAIRVSLAAPECRPICSDDAPCRPGWACDPVTDTCAAECTSDDVCRIAWSDLDGDGAADELAWLGPDHPAHCDLSTGLCVVDDGVPVQPIGSVCAYDADCGTGRRCLAGLCTIPSCEDLRCPTGSHCELGALGARSACLRDCAPFVPDGGCDPGTACERRASPEERSGCVPARPSGVAERNVGAPCTTDDECFSPFGLGICGGGTCTIVGCTATDPAPCIDGERCFVTPSARGVCLRSCADATECPSGSACVSVAPDGERGCWSRCIVSTECRPDEACIDDTGARCDGARECYCGAAWVDGGAGDGPPDGGAGAGDAGGGG